MQDFPMQASDIDSEIEIHFDITGSSRTEGKMTDIQSFFGDRLKQIRNQLILGGALPRRPISIAEAWRNRQRHTSKDYEITLVGLASESRFTRAGNLVSHSKMRHKTFSVLFLHLEQVHFILLWTD